jgi:hypothetical protein
MDGCEQCGDGEGTCVVTPPAITTVWQWLSDVNAAAFAGHGDWRLPSQSGCNSCFTGDPTFACSSCSAHELETILLAPYFCATSPCIDPIFGPTGSLLYWSSSTSTSSPTTAWDVSFLAGNVSANAKSVNDFVRAVRDAP